MPNSLNIRQGGALDFLSLGALVHRLVASRRQRQDDPVLLGFAEFIQLFRRVLGVDHGEDRIEQVVGADVLVGEEGLRHRSGIGHAGGLYHHAVELQRALLALFLERAKNPDQVANDVPLVVGPIQAAE